MFRISPRTPRSGLKPFRNSSFRNPFPLRITEIAMAKATNCPITVAMEAPATPRAGKPRFP